MAEVRVAVVGAGPAGVAAALAAADAGARVTLIDEHPIDYSMMGLDIPYLFGQRMTPTVRDSGLMLQRVIDANPGVAEAQEAGVDVLLGVYVWGSFRERENSRHFSMPALGLGNQQETWLHEYDRLVLAPGGRDLSLSFPGRELVGVVGARGMGALITKYQAFSGNRVSILGSGALAMETAKLALDHSIEVAAIVDPGPEVRWQRNPYEELKERGIPFYASHSVVRVSGAREVEALVVDSGAGSREIACDTVCLAIGLVPSVELPFLTGCDLAFDARAGGYVPRTNSNMQTGIEGVYIAGDVGGAVNEMVSKEQGARAGRAAAGETSFTNGDSSAAHHMDAVSEVEYWELWRSSLAGGGREEVTVCLCEEVSRADLESVSPPRYLGWPTRRMGERDLGSLFSEAPVSPDRLKRLTRAGMGYCQGRRCREEVALICARASRLETLEVPLASFRTPVRPLPLRSMWDSEEPEEVRKNWPKWFKRPTVKLDSLAEGG